MDDLVFPLHYTKEYRSYNAGKTFARLYYTSRTDLNVFQLERVASTFKVDTRIFDPFFYKLGFMQSYREQALKSGNRLPVTTKLVQERKQAMGKLATAKSEIKNTASFIKADDLIADEVIFCITRINQGEGQFGKQWYINLLLDGSYIGDPEATEPVERILTFQVGKTDRDGLLESLMKQADYPYHNCALKAVPLKNGNTYKDLVEDESSICPCGYVPELESSNDALGDLDSHPF